MDNSEKQNLQVEPSFVPAADFREIYTNGVRLGITPWDIRIIFSCTKLINSQPVNEDQVSMVMSPQHMKAMQKHFDAMIQSYEENFGLIPDLTGAMTASVKGTTDPLKSD